MFDTLLGVTQQAVHKWQWYAKLIGFHRVLEHAQTNTLIIETASSQTLKDPKDSLYSHYVQTPGWGTVIGTMTRYSMPGYSPRTGRP